MNIVILSGRLTKDPEVRVSGNNKKVARYTLAVDRKKEGADFITVKAFDRTAEFAEKWLRKGKLVTVKAHILTGSYEGQDGKKVYTTDIVADEHEFGESRSSEEHHAEDRDPFAEDGFMSMPEGVESALPFM